MPQDELTLVYKLRELSRTMPEFEAVVSYDETLVRSSLTVEEFYTLCAKFAHLLKQNGVLPGDYIVITVPLSIESFIITFGTVFAGAVPANLEITFKTGEGLMQCMEKLKPRLMVVQDEPWSEELKFFKATFDISFDPASIMADVKTSQLPTLEKMMLIKRSGGRDQSFVELLRASQGEYVYDGITRESIAWFSFTTGTETDYIRMSEHTHKAVINFCDVLQERKQCKRPNRLYENPLFWLTACPGDILHGITRVIPDKWSIIKDYSQMLLKIITTENVQSLSLQPINMKRILEMLKERSDDKPLVDLVECAGFPMTRRHLQHLKPMARRFVIAYGSHDVGAVAAHCIRDEDIDSYQDYDNGELLEGVKIKLLDREEREVEPGQKGRVLVKSGSMLRSYAGDPEKSAAKFNKENWFVTNDQAMVDPVTKHMFIGGRIDAIILHGMYMIFPSWLEAMVAPHAAVKEVIAVPIPDVVLFHAIGICIKRHEGRSVTKEEIDQMIPTTMVTGKEFLVKPKAIVFFDSFPTKPDGSVDRIKLSDMLAEMVEAGKV